MPVQVSRLHLLLNQTLSFLATIVLCNGRQLLVFTTVFVQKLLGFSSCGMQVHAITSILTLTESGRFITSRRLLATLTIVGLLLVATSAGTFLESSSDAPILPLLILPREDIVTGAAGADLG